MLKRDLRVAFTDRKRLRRLQEPFEAIGEFLEIHRCFPVHRPRREVWPKKAFTALARRQRS
jgi:hypothetical protein